MCCQETFSFHLMTSRKIPAEGMLAIPALNIHSYQELSKGDKYFSSYILTVPQLFPFAPLKTGMKPQDLWNCIKYHCQRRMEQIVSCFQMGRKRQGEGYAYPILFPRLGNSSV